MKKIQAITKGSQIIDKIFWELLKTLKNQSNLTEHNLTNKIRKFAKQMGAEGMAFPPIVSFGKNSTEIHHKPDKSKIGKNNFLMLDYGVKIDGYCSDFTRTLFIGKPNSLHEKIYNIVLKSQLATIKKIAVGNLADEIDFTARHIINQSGYGKYYIHGTGHGVGRQIQEQPSFKINSSDVISKDVIVTVEPGIYLPNKFGVRIEDMVLPADRKNKPRILSTIPKDFKNMII
jgi:Xaa-Pro aminopeptidase